jgi:hypothetical protein
MSNRKFEGVWIPAHIWLEESLNITEKCLLVEINSLDNDLARGCFASNEYLGKFLGLSAGRTANMVSDLKKRGYVEQVFFDGRNRGLRVPMLHENGKNLHENVKAAFTKTGKQPSRKREHINTVINNNIGESAPAKISDLTTVKTRNVDEVIKDPHYYKKAKATFETLAARGGHSYQAKYVEPYFQNEQKNRRYYDIAEPVGETDVHSWLSKHMAGVELWAKREATFTRNQDTAPGTALKLPRI